MGGNNRPAFLEYKQSKREGIHELAVHLTGELTKDIADSKVHRREASIARFKAKEAKLQELINKRLKKAIEAKMQDMQSLRQGDLKLQASSI